MWWKQDVTGDIEANGKSKIISYQLRKVTVSALLGEPAYRSDSDSGIQVEEWPCGCASCGADFADHCTLQWCVLHGAQVCNLDLI